MTAPLKPTLLAPIYALSGSPHPDTPPNAAGLAAAVESGRRPPHPRAGPRRRLPPAGGVSVRRAPWLSHQFFPISQVAVEVTPKRARLRQKFARKSYDR